MSKALDKPPSRVRRRDAILDAAETLFIENGFANVRLAEIVQRSGGSFQTMYELFSNKQGLLRAIAIRWRDETMQERQKSVACLNRPISRILMDYVRAEISLWQSARTVELMRMLVSEGLRDRDFARQVYQDLHLPLRRQLSAVFSEWAAAGKARIDDPDATANLFISTISGDTLLNRLLGIDEGMPNEDEIRWRLRPFLKYFELE